MQVGDWGRWVSRWVTEGECAGGWVCRWVGVQVGDGMGGCSGGWVCRWVVVQVFDWGWVGGCAGG